MDKLFRIADYGMDYRALSHTGRVLGGSKAETPENAVQLNDKDVPSEK